MNRERLEELLYERADRSVWGVQHHNGLSTLVRIAHPYNESKHIRDVLTLPFGKDLFDIDISPDGAFLTGSMIEVSGRQRLIRLGVEEMLAGDSSYEVLYEFANNSPANFVHSADGRYLYGTSYYSGASNTLPLRFRDAGDGGDDQRGDRLLQAGADSSTELMVSLKIL